MTVETVPGALQPKTKLLYDIAEACALTGLSRSRLYVEMASGRLAAVKVGTRRMIRASDLQAFVDALTAVA